MEMIRNRFKERLCAGELLYGFWLGLSEPFTAEICAGAGFDWLLIDGEHGPNDLRTIFAQLQAIAPYASAPVVRPPQGDHVLIKQLLETGVQTLLIPMVESAAQARHLVEAMHYPPDGIRGVGSSIARASRWGRIADYSARANAEMCLLVQVETRAGMDALDEILDVHHVDGVFFGAADLAASYGLLGQPNHPDIVARIEAGLRAARARDMPGGVLCGDPALVQRYRDAGARFIAIGVDSMLLAAATSKLLDAYRSGHFDGLTGSAY